MDAAKARTVPSETTRSFTVICVLGPPAAGKGTLCRHLARRHSLTHYSMGDDLRRYMREHDDTPLAAQIRDRLDNQGFLHSSVLNPFIGRAIRNAIDGDPPRSVGILIDGYPRCLEQLTSFDAWSFPDCVPLVQSGVDNTNATPKPDVVLSLRVTRANAEARYIERGRESSDGKEKFRRRFDEFVAKTCPVEAVYRQRGIVIEIDWNGTEEENVDGLEQALARNEIWRKVVIEG